MKRQFDYFHLFLHMMIFATIFMIVGYFAPKLYYQYVDTKQYYVIEVPIEVDKEVYHPCETVTWKVIRQAFADFDADAVIELKLINENNTEEVYSERVPLIIDKNPNRTTIFTPHQLPCKLKNGTYRYDGTVRYELKEIVRSLFVYTVPFQVVASSSGNLTN